MTNKTIIISGKQGSGKTTLANNLSRSLKSRMGYDVIHLTFAETIYKIHDFALQELKNCGIERDLVKDGYLLQLLGTEWGRQTVDEDIWVKCVLGKIKKDREIYADSIGDLKNYKSNGLIHIISDCRFKNEFIYFPDALRVRLTAPEEMRKARCSMWRDSTGHPSETDLDKFSENGYFDIYQDTVQASEAHVTTTVLAQIDKNNWKEKRSEVVKTHEIRLVD